MQQASSSWIYIFSTFKNKIILLKENAILLLMVKKTKLENKKIKTKKFDDNEHLICRHFLNSKMDSNNLTR